MKLPKPNPLERRPQRGRTPQVAVAPLMDEFDDDNAVSSIDPAIIADAGELLKKERYNGLLMTSDAGARLQWFSEHVANGRKISRKQHIDRIALAYALFAISRDNIEIRQTIVHVALERERTYNPRTSELRLLVEAFISYGTEEDDARRASHAYSRDVAAIKTLIKRGVRPSEVADLASTPGEGLDAWARESAKSRQQKHPTVDDGPSDIQAAPAKIPGKSRSMRPSSAPEPTMLPRCRLIMPGPQRFAWTWTFRNEQKAMAELEFSASSEAHDVLTRCYDDLLSLKERQSQEEKRPRTHRKLATLHVDPRRLRQTSRKKSDT